MVDVSEKGRSGHGFSTEASLLICGSKAAGVPRGMATLVVGRSPRRGGRERSERWKGESKAFPLQRDAVGNERADEPDSEPFLTRVFAWDINTIAGECPKLGDN